VWAKGGEKEGFDISLSVDRKLKLPLGSNEISNYPWNTVSPGLIAHTHTHAGNLGGRKRDARSDS